MHLPILFFRIILSALFVTVYVPLRGQVSKQDADRMIRIRQIGHEFLLSLGDSTSRVLSVREISENNYRMSFEHQFSFRPDSLARVVKRIAEKDSVFGHFSLSVTRREEAGMLYGFTSTDLQKSDIPCMGRVMPYSHYSINLFLQKKITSAGPARVSGFYGLLLAGLSFILTVCGVYFYGNNRQYGFLSGHSVRLGKYIFSPSTGSLLYNKVKIELTAKEQTLLALLSRQPNTVIDRNILLKEGWENEGVITQRSLDMYISRLRKILHKDSSISIKNVHGKGYSLNIGE